MQPIPSITRASRNLAGRIAGALWPTRWKEYNELRYWQKKKEQEGTLTNKHYQYFYTTHLGSMMPTMWQVHSRFRVRTKRQPRMGNNGRASRRS
jgi:hypothetical protein